jgi:TolB-like protein
VTAWGRSVACRPFAGDIARTGDEWGVRHVAEGSFRRIGDRLELPVSLHDVQQPTSVWSKQFDAWAAEAPTLAAHIAPRIAARIAPKQACPGAGTAPVWLPDSEGVAPA